MYGHVKTGCKHIPPSEQPLQFQSGYYLNKPRIRGHINMCKNIKYNNTKTTNVIELEYKI